MFIGNVSECLGQEGSKDIIVYTCVMYINCKFIG